MSIIIAATGIAVGSALSYGGVRRRKRYRGTFGEDTMASNFNEAVWPYTALRIKMVGGRAGLKSELPKTPQIIPFGDSEFSGYGFDVVITVPGGRTALDYSGYEGNLHTLLRAERVDRARVLPSDHQLTYRVYEVLPTDNLQKLWNWNPELATDSAVSIALGMGQREPFYFSPCDHTRWTGLSGGGKSSIFSALFQNMAADDSVEFWAIDAKPGGGDVKTWGHLCKRIAFSNGPAGDLAMLKLLGEFVEAYQEQQSWVPKDKKQIVPRGSKIGPDDIEAGGKFRTRFLLIDEYNIFCDAIRNYESAKAKSTIRQMAEEIGYDRNPSDDLSNVLNGGRSANHWLHAVGQNPLATEWMHKKLFQSKGALKLDKPTLGNFFGNASDAESARQAWESSVDRLSPAEWKKPQAGYIMVGDKDGNWSKIRMYYSEANELLKLRKAGLTGGTIAVNHQIGNSAPWSPDISSTPVAVGYGDASAIPAPTASSNNSPAPAPKAQSFRELKAAAPVVEVAPADDPQGLERGQWIIDAFTELQAAGDQESIQEAKPILVAHGITSFKQLKEQGASAALWNDFAAYIYPTDEQGLPDLFDDGAFSAVEITEWEVALENDETIADEDDLTEAIDRLRDFRPIGTETLKKIRQSVATELSVNGRTTYSRLNAALEMAEERESL